MFIYKCLLTVVFLVLSFVAAAQKAEVNKKGFFISHHKITTQTTMAVIDSLLGRPDRVSALANIIWTYDKLGVFIYFSPADSSLKQVNFQLVKKELKFAPIATFAGSLVMHDNRITKAWPLARLRRIKSLQFAADDVYRARVYTSYVKIFFEFDDAGTTLQGVGVSLTN